MQCKKDEKVYEAEVVNESEETLPEISPDGNGASNTKKVLSVLFMLFAIAYLISPVDLMIDVVPIEDIGLLLAAGLNLFQQFAKNQDSNFIKVIKFLKWILVIGVILVGLLFGGLIIAIIALAKSLS
jgi:hypothetical protein